MLGDGDLVYARTGASVGKSYLYKSPDGPLVFAGFLIRVKPDQKRLDSRFLKFQSQTEFYWKWIKENSMRSGQPGINGQQLSSLLIPLPPTKAEQEAIAGALSDADAWIESLEQLIAKKRRIKEGSMQSLLTAPPSAMDNGELTMDNGQATEPSPNSKLSTIHSQFSPSRRLPGFSGEWEVKTLGDVLKIGHGRSQHAVFQENGQYPILATGGEIGRSKDYLYNKPTVLIGRKGTINKPQYMDTPFWSVDTLFYSIINEPNSAKFLYYRFCLIDWMKHNEASGVPSLNAKTIESLEVKIPESAEQTAIADILSDMDTEIDALAAKLSKARQIKQGMMQELLTGKTRLV